MRVRRAGFDCGCTSSHARRRPADDSRLRGVSLLLLTLLAILSLPSSAQIDVAPADSLDASASQMYTWQRDDGTSVVQMDGPVEITVGKTVMSAQQAVLWVSPVRGALAYRRVEVALVGDAKVTEPGGVVRLGQRLFINAPPVRGPIRIAAPRVGGERSDSELYKAAESLRPITLLPEQVPGRWIIEEEGPPPTTLPTTRPGDFSLIKPVTISAKNLTTIQTEEGNVAAIVSGDIALLQRTSEGAIIELRADRAVLFTPYKSLTDLSMGEQITAIEKAVVGAYLEGDVRITQTPADSAEPDQRLLANRAYYDFTTDRAVLTDVVLYTYEGKINIPIIVRAQKVRQLSLQEFTAEKSRISSSSFATPSYSIGASSTYIRHIPTDNPLTTRTNFRATNATFSVGEIPAFYLPYVAGSVAQRSAFRGIETSNSSGFGFGVATEWGLFETMGRLPPAGLDATYSIDYFSDRGPAFGFDAKYLGGFVDKTTLDPWTFEGTFTSYLVFDEGEDNLGARRNDFPDPDSDRDLEPDDSVRGRFYLEHQHFFPDDWQVQLSGGYISDENFMEEWFQSDFRTHRPFETALYAKRQRDSEALTFLASVQPSDFVTVSELYQEQFEVERLPEIGYYRIGESWNDDAMTFFSANTFSRLRMDESDASLTDLGFTSGGRSGFTRSPGIPSIGQTGTEDDWNYRADFRQEVDWPFSMGQFRVVPYVMGRYTGYTETIDGSADDRLYAAGGMRMTTAFWRTDDSVESKLFDLHRLRHVIEPEFNAFAAAQSQDRLDFLIYDEPIDAISDVSATQLALRQRWQTKRGGPGRWRSVDVFSLNVAWNHFFNQPPENELEPTAFRGLYFVSMPEASVPRNSVNVDGAWQISDSVRLSGDLYYNLDESDIATYSVGFRVNQDPRLGYLVAWRHIGINYEFDDSFYVNDAKLIFEEQDLLIFGLDYQLTTNYRLNLAHSYDVAQSRTVRSTAGLIRRFDRFYAMVSVRVDKIEDESAFFFNVWPDGMEPGGGTSAVRGTFANQY